MPLANELALSAAITMPSLILTDTKTVMREAIPIPHAMRDSRQYFPTRIDGSAD
jgi:hypothetical protein